ncbi:LamG-like jellyroll fold domain-containing protein [Pontibacter sp. G13]|uniref:LamG-like jellyroll fold domain-containing protein n=1 Tax=Pontibacter sp. G13 TaxID=3074898 RepID=UPI00288ACCB5|nr:LamG-like jellyroll fold domain-containing protein [Pontibacter sp. G13]WNJ20860.1 LamG-like jellyroll fold domain-containing protein [Pontibacter sp. G13]
MARFIWPNDNLPCAMTDLKSFILWLFLTPCSIMFGQTGPGGVGTTDGNSSLRIWLRADAQLSGLEHGNPVSVWQDASGYNQHAIGVTSSPIFVKAPQGAFGGQSMLRFDDLDHLEIDSIEGGLEAFSMFMVSRKNEGGSFPATWWGSGLAGPEVGIVSTEWNVSLTSSHRLQTVLGFPSHRLVTEYPELEMEEGMASIICTQWDGIELSAALNGFWSATTTPTPIGQTACEKPIVLAATGNFKSFMDGQIAEVLLFDRALNSAETQLIHNYLSTRYQLGIQHDLFQQPEANRYDQDVFGIGKESDGAISEASGGGIRLAAGTDVGDFLEIDGRYLMIGHDNQSSEWVDWDLPESISARLSKLWYLDKTDPFGSGGELEWAFQDLDTENIGQYALLYQSAEGEPFSVIFSGGYIDGDEVVFPLNAAWLEDGFYTLGKVDLAGPGRMISLAGNKSLHTDDPGFDSEAGTLELWMKTTVFSADTQYVASGESASGNHAPGIAVIGNELAWEFGGQVATSTGLELQANKWYQVALTYQRAGLDFLVKLYVDGILVDEEFQVPSSGDEIERWNLGKDISADQHRWAGMVDEIRIWDHARTIGDIRSFLSRKVEEPLGMLRYWRLDHGGIFGYPNLLGPQQLHGIGVATFDWRNSDAVIGDESVYAYPNGANWEGLDIQIEGEYAPALTLSRISGDAQGLHVVWVNRNPVSPTLPDSYADTEGNRAWMIHSVLASELDFHLSVDASDFTHETASGLRLVAAQQLDLGNYHHGGTVYNPISRTLETTGELSDAVFTLGRREHYDEPSFGGGRALELDGYLSMLESSFVLQADWDRSLSVECWFKPSGSLDAYTAIISARTGDGNQANFEMGIDSEGQVRVYHNQTFHPGAGSVTLGTWNHIAYAYEANSQLGKIYLNGSMVGTVPVPEASPIGTAMIIGRSALGSQDFSKGMIDEVRVWNAALSQDDIRDWMCKILNWEHPKMEELAVWYPFDEDNGRFLSVEDHAGSYDGIIHDIASAQIRTEAGTPLGDRAAYRFTPDDAPELLRLSHEDGDEVVLGDVSSEGMIESIFLYQVDMPSNGRNGFRMVDWSDERYWGIFIPGANQEVSYKASVFYAGHPLSYQNEAGTVVANRSSNAEPIWSNTYSDADYTAQRIDYLGSGSSEMILGQADPFFWEPLVLSVSQPHDNKGLKLAWQPISSESIVEYVLEKSSNGHDFEVAATWQKDGEKWPDLFEYIDHEAPPESQVRHYRVLAIDHEGHFRNSNIESWRILGTNAEFTVFPNPVSETAILFPLFDRKWPAQIQLLDLSGRQLGFWELQTDWSSLNIPVQHLAVGTYVLRIQYGTQVFTERLLIGR